MGQTNEPAGHPILSGNNRNAFQIHEYSSPFRVCHVVVGKREGQIPGQIRVSRDLVLKQRIQYAHNFLLSKVCRTTQIFPTRIGVRTTNLNVDILVYMAWCCLRRSSVNFTTPERGVDLIDVSAKCRACFLTNGIGVVRCLLNGPLIQLVPRILEHLQMYFSRMDVYGTQEAGRNKAGL